MPDAGRNSSIYPGVHEAQWLTVFVAGTVLLLLQALAVDVSCRSCMKEVQSLLSVRLQVLLVCLL